MKCFAIVYHGFKHEVFRGNNFLEETWNIRNKFSPNNSILVTLSTGMETVSHRWVKNPGFSQGVPVSSLGKILKMSWDKYCVVRFSWRNLFLKIKNKRNWLTLQCSSRNELERFYFFGINFSSNQSCCWISIFRLTRTNSHGGKQILSRFSTS